MGHGDRFERWSLTYERSWLQGIIFDRVHAAVTAVLVGEPTPRVLLDVGCGTGRLLRSCRRLWPEARLIGVDATQGMIREAQRLTPDALFHVAPAEALPVPAASVDLALSTMSFHHWSDQAAGLREVARVLRPGGRFILADPSGPPWLARLFGDPPYLRAAEVRDLFQAAGLRVLRQWPALSRHILATAGERPPEGS